MTEVIHSSPSSSSPSTISTPTHTIPHSHPQHNVTFLHDNEDTEEEALRKNSRNTSSQLSLLALLVDLFRKSFMMACKAGRGEMCTTSAGRAGATGMEIGWPTDVQHVAHVTFDRFNGFLGLPVEFEPEVPRRAPSASTTVFGVSTESMQLSYDHRGNSIPTILLLMQRRLYVQGGLQAEGIFRINGENSQNEYVRDQLNRGVVPDGIDVHCLAGLIKAWFRELPKGILDPLSPERVMQCQSEEDCVALVRLLPPIESALLDWALNLMADVVQEEHLNKMNSRNIAMVFAPNMTQMADPLTALMYAVQLMNFLKTLIERVLREREDTAKEPPQISQSTPFDEDGHQKPSQVFVENVSEPDEVPENVFVVEEPESDTPVEKHDSDTVADNQSDNISDESVTSYSTSTEEFYGSESCETPNHDYIISTVRDDAVSRPKTSKDDSPQKSKILQLSDSDQPKSVGQQLIVQSVVAEGKSKGNTNLSRINSITERVEAWR